MFKTFEEFLNENEQNSLSFKVEDNSVDIRGKVFDIFELFKKYDHLVEYAFATYLYHDPKMNTMIHKQLIYIPEEKKFRETKNSSAAGKGGQVFDVSDMRKVKFRTIKIKPGFITGMEIESVLKNTPHAAYHKQVNPNYVEIIGDDDELIKSYRINRTTGELE